MDERLFTRLASLLDTQPVVLASVTATRGAVPRKAGARMLVTADATEFSVGGTPSIGMMAKPSDMPAHVPSYWMPYFQVTNADSSASKAKDLGGKVMVPPQDIPNAGRFAILVDPQGAMFAVFQRKD